MKKYSLSESEARFAEIIWGNEPLASKELVRVCGEEFGWKSTTTYTVLRRLCDKGVFQNENSVITSKISRDKYLQQKAEGLLRKRLTARCHAFWRRSRAKKA